MQLFGSYTVSVVQISNVFIIHKLFETKWRKIKYRDIKRHLFLYRQPLKSSIMTSDMLPDYCSADSKRIHIFVLVLKDNFWQKTWFTVFCTQSRSVILECQNIYTEDTNIDSCHDNKQRLVLYSVVKISSRKHCCCVYGICVLWCQHICAFQQKEDMELSGFVQIVFRHVLCNPALEEKTATGIVLTSEFVFQTQWKSFLCRPSGSFSHKNDPCGQNGSWAKLLVCIYDE